MTVSLSTAHHRDCTARATKSRASVATYFATWKQRRELARLDHNRLKDLGISPRQAANEAARPFWDLPK